MNVDRLSSLMSRLFFYASLLFLALAIVEKVANLARYTVLRNYTPEKLLEAAATMMIFVIALLLRQIREGQHRPRGAGV